MDWKEFTQRLARELMHLPANAFLVVQVPGGFPYAQAMRYPTGLSAEVVSNEFLPEPLHLRPEQEHLLVELDWQRPGAHGHVNWWQQLALPPESDEFSPEQSMASGRLAMSMALALNRVFNVASPHHLEYRANRNGPDGGPIELPYFGIPSIDAPRPVEPDQPAPEPEPEPEVPSAYGRQFPGPATEADAWHPDPYTPTADPYAPTGEPETAPFAAYQPAAEPQPNPYAPASEPNPYAPTPEPEPNPYAPRSDFEATPRTPPSGFDPNPYAPTSTPEINPYAPTSNPETSPYAPASNPETNPYAPVSEPDTNPYAPVSEPETNPYAPLSEPEPSPYAPASRPEPNPYAPAAEHQASPYAPASEPETNPYAPTTEPETSPYAPIPEPKASPYAPVSEPEPTPYAPFTKPIAIPPPSREPEPEPVPVSDSPAVPLAETAEPPASRLFFAPMHAGGVLVTTQPPITDPAEVDRVAGYLRRGAGVLSGGAVADEIEPGRGEVVPMVFLTDGVWVWTGAQRYYLEHYGLPPYPAFYEHIVAQGYQTPDVPDDLLAEAGELAKGTLPPAPLPPVNDPAPWLTLATTRQDPEPTWQDPEPTWQEPEPTWQDRTAPLPVQGGDADSWAGQPPWNVALQDSQHPTPEPEPEPEPRADSWAGSSAGDLGPPPWREQTTSDWQPQSPAADETTRETPWTERQDTPAGDQHGAGSVWNSPQSSNADLWSGGQSTAHDESHWTGQDSGLPPWSGLSGGGEGSSWVGLDAAGKEPVQPEDEDATHETAVPQEDQSDRPAPLPKRIPRSQRAEPAAGPGPAAPLQQPGGGFVEQPAAGGISGFVEPPAAGSAPGFVEPAAPAVNVFEPPEPVLLYNAQQAELERDLERARQAGDHRTYFGLILRAELFLPSNGDPAERQYATADFNDGTYVLAFTSPAALESGLHGQVVRHRRVSFKELLAEWPNPAWRLAVNAGLATAAYVDPATVESLAGPVPVEQQPIMQQPIAQQPVAQQPVAQQPIVQQPVAQQAVVQPQIASPPAAYGRTIMQKVLQPDHVVHYLQHSYDRVAGYVYQLQDVLGLKTPALLVDALGLVYEDSPFSAEDEFIHVLRWPVVKPEMCRRSTLRYAEESIPEFKMDSQRLPHGSELYRLDRSGKQILLAVYDADRLRWRRPDA